MELARNPAMLQELMRSQDRAMSNLEVHLSLFLSLSLWKHKLKHKLIYFAMVKTRTFIDV